MQVCAIARILPLPLLCLLPNKLNSEDEELQPCDAEKATPHADAVGKGAFVHERNTNNDTQKA